MSADRFATCLARVLRHEGGYVDHPDDPGGATSRGVTQRTYDAWTRVAGLPSRSVREIEPEEVAAIYHEQYWTKAGAGLPIGLDYAVFDYAVNSGPTQAARDLQRVLGVDVDGIIGAQTKAAAQDAATGGLDESDIEDLCARRLRMLRGLKHWRIFGRGWTARVNAVKDTAINDATGHRAPVEAPPPTPKADPAARKPSADISDALGNAKAWTGPLGAVGAFLVSVSDMPEPIQWAIAGGFVLLAAAGAVMLVRRATR